MRRLWLAFIAVMVVSFAILSWIGVRIYQEMPPIPDKVVTTDGDVLIGSGEITAGQNVWQAMGGMQVGSVESFAGWTAANKRVSCAATRRQRPVHSNRPVFAVRS